MLIDKNKSKVKTYLTQQDCDNENNKGKNDYFEKLNYFDSNYENLNDFKNTVLINNAISLEVFCRRCHKNFTFNNQLHKHLRINICTKSLNRIFSKILYANVFVNNHTDFFFDSLEDKVQSRHKY